MRILTDALNGLDLANLPDGVKLAVTYLRVSTSAQADTDFDEEGFSLPAQREANQRTADRLGAIIVAEFLDRGESAKTADRPELQAMLKFLGDLGSISYVIVDKVDRLARNREDDALINIAIRKAGAKLVSSKENIDETPSGKLLHGIMATIAEFYSSNLAMEAMKGMRQKAKSGGTPGLAPLGYLNVGQRIEGRNIRTVIVDSDRAPLIQWMFSAYATGDWTMSQIRDELKRRGLHIPATRKRPARPVSIQHVDKMLTNRYYVGYVKFEGVWYNGRHQSLVSQDIFDRVQAIRIARALTREKIQKHPHYLKGSIYCGHCGARLGVMNAKNRWGTVYPYFYCLGRAKRNSCPQSTVLIGDIEASVADWWMRVQLTEPQIVEIRDHVARGLAGHQTSNQQELDRQHRRVRTLKNQRLKLLEAHYADAIPVDMLKSEQERISRELAGAQQIIDRCSIEIDALLTVVEEALLLCANAHRLYLSAPPPVRRQLNQAVFTRFWIIGDQVRGADLTEAFARLLATDATDSHDDACSDISDNPARRPEPTPGEGRPGRAVPATGQRRPHHGRSEPIHLDSASAAAVWPTDAIQRPHGPLPGEVTNPRPSRTRGSNIHTLG